MNTPNSVRLMAATTSLFMTSGAVLADVTPSDVWSDWKGYMTGFGYEVSADESITGEGLALSNLTLGIPVPEAGGTVTMTMSEILFGDNGDGTVSIAFPEEMPIAIKVPGPDPVDFDLIYTTRDMDMVVSGDPSEMTYTYSAAMIGVAMGDFRSGTATINLGTIEMNIADVSGTSVQTPGALRTVDQSFTTGALTYNVDVTDPEDADSRFVLSGGTESTEWTTTMALPEGIDMEDMAAALKAGFAVDGGYTAGPGNMNFNFSEDGQITQGTTSSQGSSAEVTMDEGRLRYDIGTKGLDMQIASAEVPFPLAMQMGEMAFELLMPVSKSDAEQDFGLTFVMGDVTVSDMIWGLVDPAAQLPRDPATIALDLGGKAKLFFDLLDPEQQQAASMGEMPGELNALSLNTLILRIAGAELTGDGDFTFDNSDLDTYDGMPKPIGAINLNLSGGNSLLDTLVAMGLVPEENAMGARMMMGMFAVPGDAPDQLKSTIEFNEQGQILANGQRLK